LGLKIMATLINYFILIRPKQWLKNVLVFAGIIFGCKFFEIESLINVMLGFISFSLVSSGLYVVNDVIDKEKDSLHPVKNKRPIASGKIKPLSAIPVSLILLIAGVYLSYSINLNFFYCIIIYFIIMISYSFYLKNIAILDALIISAGFVIRAVSGAYIVRVEISPWLLICTFLLALLIAFGKRRNEITVLGDSADSHRKNLKDYSVQILDYYIAITASCSVIAYSLYCISDRTEKAFHTDKLIFTIPFVIYGIFRYLYLLFFKKIGGEPELLLFRDKSLLLDVILWSGTSILIIYKYSLRS